MGGKFQGRDQTIEHCSAVRQSRTVGPIFTIIETEIFKRYAESIWDDGERHEFITWLAANPLAGDVVPGSVGMRKVRWSRSGMGKRGGTRVSYYNTLSEGSIWLLIAYTKAKFDNLPAAFLKQLKEEISNGQ
ncbi:putative transcriptional regulator [Pseudomonas sp. IT-P171]